MYTLGSECKAVAKDCMYWRGRRSVHMFRLLGQVCFLSACQFLGKVA